PAHATDGQVAGHFIVVGPNALAVCALEGDGAVLGHVEEISAAQMVVALRLAGPQQVGLDRRLDGQVAGGGRGALQGAMHILEMAPHPGHHHVWSAELRRGMPGLKNPSGHGGPPRSNNILVRLPAWADPWSVEANRAPTSSSSRTFEERQATGWLRR